MLTTLAFPAERSAGGVTGTIDCLALAPEAATGKSSPGATAVLTVDTLPTFPFHEVLLQGSFEVRDED